MLSAAVAQDDSYSPDRPGVTNGPSIQQKNTLSVEVGVMNFEHTLREYSFAETLLRYGIIEDVAELRFGWNGFLSNVHTAGGGDITLGTKLKFLNQETAQFDVGILADATLNVGEAEFAADRNDISLLLMASRDILDSVSYTGNYGVTFSTTTSHFWTSAIDYSVTDTVGILSEVFGGFEDGTKPSFNIGGGIYKALTRNLQVDASFGSDQSHSESDWFVSIGVAVRLPQ
jgi:hypothetical protein